jgi:hypothetical protein
MIKAVGAAWPLSVNLLVKVVGAIYVRLACLSKAIVTLCSQKLSINDRPDHLKFASYGTDDCSIKAPTCIVTKVCAFDMIGIFLRIHFFLGNYQKKNLLPPWLLSTFWPCQTSSGVCVYVCTCTCACVHGLAILNPSWHPLPALYYMYIIAKRSSINNLN